MDEKPIFDQMLEAITGCKVVDVTPFPEKTEQEMYDDLQRRMDASINQWRLLAAEAYRAGDEAAVWEAGAHIKDLEKKKRNLRKPGCAYDPKP